MKRLLVILAFLALASEGFGAITERYVTDAGAGAADGTSEANAMSFATFRDYMESGGSFTAAAGDRFNVKGAITGGTSALTWANGGTAVSPVVIRGYSSAITDGYQGRTSGNGALVTTNLPVFTFTSSGRVTLSASFIIVDSISITAAVASPTINATGSDIIIQRSVITNSNTGGSTALTIAGRGTAFDCDISLTGASGGTQAVSVSAVGALLDGCRIKCTSSTANVVTMSSSGVCSALHNTIYSGGAIGIAVTATGTAAIIAHNTVVTCGGDGINVVTGSTVLNRIFSNMITDNTGDGIDMVSTNSGAWVAYNRLRDNANSFANAGDWITATSYGQSSLDTGTTGTTATDYVNYAGNDYSLVATSPATSASQPAYQSVGALQRSQTGGGETSYGFSQ